MNPLDDNVQSQRPEDEHVQELGYPAREAEESPLGLPPGGGRDLIPHYTTFSSILNYVTRTYRWTFDAARKHSDTNALAIRNDTDIMEALRARQMPTAQLPWHIEPRHPNVQSEVDAAQVITEVVNLIPRFQQFRLHLLEAIWFGRHAVAVTPTWDYSEQSTPNIPIAGPPLPPQPYDEVGGSQPATDVGGASSDPNAQPAPADSQMSQLPFGGEFEPEPTGPRRRLLIRSYRPVNGDKLVFKFGGQVGILVHQQYEGSWQVTDRGRAHFLTPEEREQLIVHEHEPEDADFFQGELAGAIHGVGVRGRVYWLWWLKTQVLGWLMDYLERVGAGGFTIAFYEHGNPTSEAEVQAAMQSQLLNNIILFPRYKQGGTGGPGIERIEPSNAGATLLQNLVSEYFDVHIRRYIVGMNLASERDDKLTIGEGTNAQDLSTFGQRIKFDAENLDATLTAQLLPVLYKYNCPGVPVGKFVSEVERPNAGELLEGAKAFYEMGGSVDEEDLRGILGLAAPEPGHNTLTKVPPIAPVGYGTTPGEVPQLNPAGPNAPGGGGPTAGNAEGGGESTPPVTFARDGDDYVYWPEAGGWLPLRFAAEQFAGEPGFKFPGVHRGEDSLSGLLSPRMIHHPLRPQASLGSHEALLRHLYENNLADAEDVASAVLRHGWTRMEQMRPHTLDIELHHSMYPRVRRWVAGAAEEFHPHLRDVRYTIYGDDNGKPPVERWQHFRNGVEWEPGEEHYTDPHQFLAGDPGERGVDDWEQPARDGGRMYTALDTDTEPELGGTDNELRHVAESYLNKQQTFAAKDAGKGQRIIDKGPSATIPVGQGIHETSEGQQVARHPADYANPMHWLTAEEVNALKGDQKQIDRLNKVYANELEHLDARVGLAKAGRTQRHWYGWSNVVHNHLFPSREDKVTHAGLQASASAATPPDIQMHKALRVWQAWEVAGRLHELQGTSPEHKAQIAEDLYRLVTRFGFPAEWNNQVRALYYHKQPEKQFAGLGRYKISAYARNLVNDCRPTTNDRWMFRLANLPISEMNHLGSQLALSALHRATAARLNEDPSERGWTGEQVQAAQWNVAKALGDRWVSASGQEEHPETTFGKLTHKDILDYGNLATNVRDDPITGDLLHELKLHPARRAIVDALSADTRHSQSFLHKPIAEGVHTDMGPFLARLQRRLATGDKGSARNRKQQKKKEYDDVVPFQRLRYTAQQPNQMVQPDSHWLRFSPNTDTLSPEEAIRRYRSANQAAFHRIADDNARKVGLQAKTVDVIGAWNDPNFGVGAENGVMQVIPGRQDPAKVEYLAAWHGLTGNQHAVAAFHPTENGPDSVYQVNIPEPDTMKVLTQLDAHGIRSRAVIPYQGGNTVVFADPGRKLRPNVATLAGKYNAKVAETVGTYHELGGGQSRSDARSRYRAIIAKHERGGVR